MAAPDLQAALAAQRRAFLADGFPDLATRIDRLDRLIAMLLRHDADVVESLAADFGGRSRFATLAGDVVGGVNAIRYNRDHLRAWMQPQPIALPPAMEAAGARAELRHEPLGVVGAIVPWNGPVLLACLAAAGVLAAGNRLMLKVPELTPRASRLIARMFADSFDATEVCVVEGDSEVGAAFSCLPFDHLLFTGSAAVARQVMKAAAEHLVPVTLELGGKNPVIIGASADLPSAAARLATGKLASAGQVCVSPDYVLTPAGSTQALVQALSAQAATLYPSLCGNDDYTAIISERHFERLRELLHDARAKGAQLIEINPDGAALWQSGARKFPLCVLTGVTPDMRVMQEEIFGPILPVIEYRDLHEAIDTIAHGDSPLSAYYFGHDDGECEAVVRGIRAGNMVINDVRCQLFFEQLPFGGVGGSGMGRYRGQAGFHTFSNAKAIIHQMRGDAALAAQRPPFAPAAHAALAEQVAALKRSCLGD
ncbi:MAG: aldehyde dehydrogenase family protein [Burkholderiales bacterium]|nr:aldehyde dehydrogenase family protein [Burkholderiales bacterium]